jgi:FkbM family methyltransferase
MLIARSVDLIPWKMRAQIRKVPVVAYCQRWLLDRLMKGQEFDHVISAGPAKGLKFPVRLPDDKLFWTGTWEQSVTMAIAAVVRPGMICCDIGAHRGFVAGVMACAGGRPVYCIEPNPANIKRVMLLQRLNPQFDFRVIEAAIGARDEKAEFLLMPEASMGKLATSAFQIGASRIQNLTVQVRTLDNLVKSGKMEAPSFIKIDIEGAELEALSGAQKIIRRHKPGLMIELHSADLARKCRCFLEAFGYQISYVDSYMKKKRNGGFRVCHMLAKSN